LPATGALSADFDPAERRLAVAARLAELFALFAEEFHGLVGVAAGLGEGLLALHHRQIGALAQRLDGGSGDFSHGKASVVGCARTTTNYTNSTNERP
jgi:hypothetical protein